MFQPLIYPDLGDDKRKMDEQHVPASGFGRYVAIIRSMRDGTVTREYLPEYLAETLVSMIPFSEPNVASARIGYSEL
jgi:hypothetical protein